VTQPTLPSEFYSHYGSGYEASRLDAGMGRLEHARTVELIERYLPEPPAAILDVGGGPGTYACWLARKGYEVNLIDAMPLHVEQARAASAAQPEHPLAGATVGDARALDCADGSADLVLLFGPLYHLTQRQDRLTALKEAHRALRPGGALLATSISRFTSVLDGLRKGFIDDPDFVDIIKQDLKSGQHRNPGNHPEYFMTAFFHHPDELSAEIKEAGFRHEATLAIEGPGWLLQNLDDHWRDQHRRERLLTAVRWLEGEPSVLGVSAHMMAIARKAAEGSA
jgi:ubiquinone/menaquinone biosynthesis C-methylase UbiE